MILKDQIAEGNRLHDLFGKAEYINDYGTDIKVKVKSVNPKQGDAVLEVTYYDGSDDINTPDPETGLPLHRTEFPIDFQYAWKYYEDDKFIEGGFVDDLMLYLHKLKISDEEFMEISEDVESAITDYEMKLRTDDWLKKNEPEIYAVMHA